VSVDHLIFQARVNCDACKKTRALFPGAAISLRPTRRQVEAKGWLFVWTESGEVHICPKCRRGKR